jgi:hypothetical protein
LQTHQIQISVGREMVHEIRAELFGLPEVLEVFSTSRPDSLVVVSSGRPRPARWLAALAAAGYPVMPRRHATATPAAPSRERTGARPALPPPQPHAQQPVRRRPGRQVLLRPQMP